MKQPPALRDEFLKTIAHFELVAQRVQGATQPRGKVFASTDQHKLAEGLFLGAWTHWEQFVRELFITDLASAAQGVLLSEVRAFRTKGAPHRLASRILDHPDDERWIEWSKINDIRDRADTLLGSPHRYVCLTKRQATFQTLSPIRNAVAHKSDVAWAKFRRLVQAPPFSLSPKQMKGLTVGRFLTAHRWGTNLVLDAAISHLRDTAQALVP